jgi:hypothetical protein
MERTLARLKIKSILYTLSSLDEKGHPMDFSTTTTLFAVLYALANCNIQWATAT